jgi:hypothetical protein
VHNDLHFEQDLAGCFGQGCCHAEPASSPTATQEHLLPDSQDVQFYRTHGFWISPVIIPEDVLDAAERGMQRYHQGDLPSER